MKVKQRSELDFRKNIPLYFFSRLGKLSNTVSCFTVNAGAELRASQSAVSGDSFSERLDVKYILGVACAIMVVGSKAEAFDYTELECIVIKYEDLFKKTCTCSEVNVNPSCTTCEFIEGAKNGELSTDDWRSLLIRYAYASAGGELSGGERSYFIQDDEVVELCIAALGCGNETLRSVACKTLASKIGNKKRARFASAIKATYGSVPLEESHSYVSLYCMCNPEDQDKEAILSWLKDDYDDFGYVFVRALCGDTTAEKQLITAFKNSTDYTEAVELAEYLSFIGNQKCAEVLIEKLGSDLFESRGGGFPEGGVISIRVELLRCLGMIYEDEPLFTTDAIMISSYSGRKFEKERGHDKYVEEVNRWVEKHFGHPAWSGPDVWFRGTIIEKNGIIKVEADHLIFSKFGDGSGLPPFQGD